MNSRILPTLSLVLAAGILFGYAGPAWSGSIAETKAAIALDDQALAAAKEYAAQQNSLASARSAIDPAHLDRLETFLPDSVDNVGLILDLNALAARSGLSLSDVDVITSDTDTAAAAQRGSLPGSSVPDPVGSVNISLTAVGTFNALQTFMAGVERSTRLLDFQDVVVKGSNTGVYTYQMTLRLYWLR